MVSLASTPGNIPAAATETPSASDFLKKSAAERVADLLVDPSEIRFKDFEDPRYPIVGAVQDYSNVFAPLALIWGGFEIEISMSLLKGMKDLGVPWISDYFCAKAIAGGVSMNKEGIEAWNALPAAERAKFSRIFYERYFSDFDWKQMAIVDLVEQDAYLLDLLLRGEWPDETDKKACRHFVAILADVAARWTRRIRLLDDPESMEREIELSRKS